VTTAGIGVRPDAGDHPIEPAIGLGGMVGARHWLRLRLTRLFFALELLQDLLDSVRAATDWSNRKCTSGDRRSVSRALSK
jgi:hypothetical protein